LANKDRVDWNIASGGRGPFSYCFLFCQALFTSGESILVVLVTSAEARQPIKAFLRESTDSKIEVWFENVYDVVHINMADSDSVQ
jgi:hypothetical protein